MSVSGISQGMGQKNAEMGKAHFSVLKMGKVGRLLKVSFFFTPILGEDFKNVVFSRCVVTGADLGGGCRGCAHPPPPEMTYGFLIQLVCCQKKKKLCGLLVLK